MYAIIYGPNYNDISYTHSLHDAKITLANYVLNAYYDLKFLPFIQMFEDNGVCLLATTIYEFDMKALADLLEAGVTNMELVMDLIR